MTEIKLGSIINFRSVLSKLFGKLIPFAQEYSGEETGIPDSVVDVGLCGQTGKEDPLDNRGVTGIQITRGFYNIYLKAVSNVSSGLDGLVKQILALHDTFIRDYAHNDRRKDDLLTYANGDVRYKEDAQGFITHELLNEEEWQQLSLLHDRGKTVLYEPSVYVGPVPSWAIDIGAGDTYSFSDYPGLNNEDFIGIINSMSDFGASVGVGVFTAPDLRGISPGLFTSVAGKYIPHSCSQHTHASGNVSINLLAANSVHGHSGAAAGHAAHTHSLTFRLGNVRPYFDPEQGMEEQNFYLCNNGNDKQSWTVYVSGVSNHTHTITVGSGIESHKHVLGGTMTTDTASEGYVGAINRVSTYPVHFIVRVE